MVNNSLGMKFECTDEWMDHGSFVYISSQMHAYYVLYNNGLICKI